MLAEKCVKELLMHCVFREKDTLSQIISKSNCLDIGLQIGKEMYDDLDAPRPKRERKQAQAFIAIERVSKPLVIEVGTLFVTLAIFQ
jgi:hypothetical protein